MLKHICNMYFHQGKCNEAENFGMGMIPMLDLIHYKSLWKRGCSIGNWWRKLFAK